TRHILDAAALAWLAPAAVVINTSRGGVVDDVALADAVRRGHLAGAALDVFEEEPLTEEGALKFAGLDNIVLTPHIAGLTAESNTRVSEVTVANVLQTLTTS
ncbi:MAG: NAD(P)-dependent oxidoreductase, partial [Acidimicrobiia bacterium]